MAGWQARHEGFQFFAPFLPRQCAYILAFDQQRIIQAYEGRTFRQHLLTHRLAPEPLLQGIETGSAALLAGPGLSALYIAAHKQLSVKHRRNRKRAQHFGECRGNIIAATRINSRFAASVNQLHTNPVPLPLRCIVRHVDGCFFQRMRQHEGTKCRQIGDIRRCLSIRSPGKQFFVRRGEAVPILFNVFDRHVEALRKGHFAQPAGHADPHSSGGQFQQCKAAGRIQPVEKRRQFHRRGFARHCAQDGDRFAYRWRCFHISAGPYLAGFP